MGRDKLPLTIGGTPLIERATGALTPLCDEVLVVGSPPGPLPPGTRPVPDLRPEFSGPLAGIEAGLAAARNPVVFVAAGDMPFLTARVVGGIAAHLGAGVRIAVPRHGGRVHPLCAAYDRGVLEDLSARLDDGDAAVWRVLEGIDGVEYLEGERLCRLGDPAHFLMNVNTPEDLEQAQRVARGRAEA